MATSSQRVSTSEINENITSAARAGVKVKSLKGPAAGKTGQRNSGMKFKRS